MAWHDPTSGAQDPNVRRAYDSLGERIAALEAVVERLERHDSRGLERGTIRDNPVRRERHTRASPLAWFSYLPAAAINITSTAADGQDVDAANAIFQPFHVPPSGKVIVNFQFGALGPAGLASIMVGIREGTVAVANSWRWATFTNSTYMNINRTITVVGLTPGQQKVWKMASKLDAAGTGSIMGGSAATGHWIEGTVTEIVEET